VPDNAYIGNVYRAVNAAQTADGKPTRLITSSWRSQPNIENYNTYDAPPGGPAAYGLNTSWRFLSSPEGVADGNGRTSHWLNGACGVAKWSCVTAPSRTINSTTVSVVNGVPQPRYQALSGTSMAGPHSAAALALVMSRFPYMTNEQTLCTLFTTGRQNSTISNASGAAMPTPDAGKMVQVPDARNGWGTVSLREAFRGPGQLLGPVNLDMHGYSDVWSNDISAGRAKERTRPRRRPGGPPRSPRAGPRACPRTRVTPTSPTPRSGRAANRHATPASTPAA
jgi:hypothetical protein